MGESVNKEQAATVAPSAPTTESLRSFANFLESVGADAAHYVAGLVKQSSPAVLQEPELELHCDVCKGNRRFACSDTNSHYIGNDIDFEFVTYTCKNCGKTRKVFALAVAKDGYKTSGRVQKLGELPPFGPPTPSRVMKLVGEDRELFLKGRRAELHGLGIGAFAYYRRVVEEQKGRIIEEIGKAAVKLKPSKETAALFARAKGEAQFSTAIDLVKSAIPESLLIDGHNPLTLLHSALSEGLHAQSDEACLELATDIRVLLTELAERISTALKEEAALKSAVSRLFNRKSG